MHEYFSIKNENYSHGGTYDFNYSFWRGFKNYVDQRISDGSFGLHFPYYCPDYEQVIAGTDKTKFFERLEFELPYAAGYYNYEHVEQDWQCEIMPIADTIEFCYRYISKPLKGKYHQFMEHYHLSFDEEAGKDEFREFIVHIFTTHRLNYTLTKNGNVERVGDSVLTPLLSSPYKTTDEDFNNLMSEAYKRFRSPNVAERRIALEKAVDALERLEGRSNRSALSDFIDQSSRSHFKNVVEKDVDRMFYAANNIQIRHHKSANEPISEDAHVDYLFYRVINYIKLYYVYRPF